jgi:hypothetical protein
VAIGSSGPFDRSLADEARDFPSALGSATTSGWSNYGRSNRLHYGLLFPAQLKQAHNLTAESSMRSSFGGARLRRDCAQRQSNDRRTPFGIKQIDRAIPLPEKRPANAIHTERYILALELLTTYFGGSLLTGCEGSPSSGFTDIVR